MKTLVWMLAGTALLAACNPFGLPATRALENGAANMLMSAKSFQMDGHYKAAGATWTVTVQLTRPDREHVIATSNGQQLEAVVIGSIAYFRGQDFLKAHLTDARSQALVSAAGSAWWKGIAVDVPSYPDLTGGPAFRTNFIGPAVTSRVDGQSVNGADAVELSGARADVYIGTDPPYPLLRLRIKDGVTVDGITDADFAF